MTRLKCKFKKFRDMYDKKYQNIVNSKSDFFRKIYLHYFSFFAIDSLQRLQEHVQITWNLDPDIDVCSSGSLAIGDP